MSTSEHRDMGSSSEHRSGDNLPVTEQRAHWARHMEFVVTCIGYAVGLGNVWRFPHLCYSNGGGAFLIPYFTSLFLLGIPVFFLEIVFGQFSSTGTISAWEINPLFKGLGYTMVLVSAEIGIYYNVVIAVSIYFMFASMQSTLPWSTCNNDWNSCYCRPDELIRDGTDFIIDYQDKRNCTGINITEESRKSPSEEYYYNKLLEMTSGIEDSGGLKWDLTLCNLLIWLILFFSVFHGVKTLGKVVYFTAFLPYILMTALLLKGVTLPGASKGVQYYMSFQLDKIMNAEVWKAAGSQILFSLSCCMGSLMAMSSYNHFHANSIRDSFVIPLINCGTSFYVGFAIFIILGYMGEVTGRDIANVSTSGPGLVFVTYPVALAQMPLPQMWSFFFFLMMVLLGLGSQFPCVETVVTAFQDEFPMLRKARYNMMFRFSICFGGFLLGLPQTTRGGQYVLEISDIFIEFPLLLVGLLQVVAIVWVYGSNRFSEDMMLMLGYSKCNRIVYHAYLKGCLKVITPVFVLWIILYNAVEYKPITADGAYPFWAEIMGWLIVTFVMMWTPLWFIFGYCCQGGFKLLVSLNQPTPKWGPADPENRTIPRYCTNVQQFDQETASTLPVVHEARVSSDAGRNQQTLSNGPIMLSFESTIP